MESVRKNEPARSYRMQRDPACQPRESRWTIFNTNALHTQRDQLPGGETPTPILEGNNDLRNPPLFSDLFQVPYRSQNWISQYFVGNARVTYETFQTHAEVVASFHFASKLPSQFPCS